MPSTTETDAPMRPTALAAGPLVPTVDSQRPLAPCHDASTGTKLSRHAPPAGDTGTKLSQHARNTSFRRILRQQGELCTASTTTKPSRANFSQHAPPSAHPVQNSPSTPETPLFGAFCASRESFIPLPPPPDQAGRKKSRTGRAKRGGASPYNPRNALIAGISRTAWTRPAR